MKFHRIACIVLAFSSVTDFGFHPIHRQIKTLICRVIIQIILNKVFPIANLFRQMKVKKCPNSLFK